jgi:hypothetical protein
VFHPFHAKFTFNTGSVESIINVASDISSLEFVTLSTAIILAKTSSELTFGRFQE